MNPTRSKSQPAADNAGSPLPPPRVFVIGGPFSPDCMEWHVMDGLRALGCPSEFFGTTLRIGRLGNFGNMALERLAGAVVREPERLSERRLLAAVERFAPSLIIVIQGHTVSPKTVAAIRARCRAPIVCWCQDQLTALRRQYMLGSEYDRVFVKDRYMQDLFSRMIRSTSFHYLPEACNPRVHRPLEIGAEDRKRYGSEVMVAGLLYYYRQEILRQLEEFDLRMWGNVPDWIVNRLGRRHMGGEVLLDEKVRAVRAARIALNPLHFAEIDSLNCRAFELAGCGAFQMMTARPVLREHFEPGLEVETFESIEELIEKIRHYLKHPQQAAEIAERGRLRAHREHTYEVRLEEIFRTALG